MLHRMRCKTIGVKLAIICCATSVVPANSKATIVAELSGAVKNLIATIHPSVRDSMIKTFLPVGCTL